MDNLVRMRLTVRRVVGAAALYPNRAALKRTYPGLDDEDVHRAIELAAVKRDDHIIRVIHFTSDSEYPII